MKMRESLLLLCLLVPLRPQVAAADGIKGQAVPLLELISLPAYAVAVDEVRPVPGKAAISAVVRQIFGADERPGSSDALKVSQRVELPTYRPPRPVAHKWVLAERYWNPCRARSSERLLLVRTSGYFETLCDNPANRQKLQLFSSLKAQELFSKRSSTLLRRGLADPDTYRWARQALQKRGQLRARDVIAAAQKLPDGCGVAPLLDQSNQLQGRARIAFARQVLAQLAASKRERFADFMRAQLEDEQQRALILPALAQLRRMIEPDAQVVRRVCRVLGPIAEKLAQEATDQQRAAARALLTRMRRDQVFDERCRRVTARLEQASQARARTGR